MMEGKKIEIVTKKKKGFGQWLITILAIVGGIFLLALAIGLFFGKDYPKSESELLSLYCGKYWKYSEIEIQEVYRNGQLIKEKEGGPLNVYGALNAEENAKIKMILEGMKKVLDEVQTKDNFRILQKDSKDENLWQYNQEFSTDINGDIYEMGYPKLSFSDGKYILKFDDGIVETFNVSNGESINSSNQKDHIETIESITNEKLKINSATTFVFEDGTEFKAILNISFIPTQPNSLDRYIVELSFWKQLYGGYSQENNSTGGNSDAVVDTTAAF